MKCGRLKYFDPSEGACSKTYKCPTEAEKKAAEEKAAKEKAAKEEAAKEKVAKEKAEKEKAVKAAVLEAAKKAFEENEKICKEKKLLLKKDRLFFLKCFYESLRQLLQ